MVVVVAVGIGLGERRVFVSAMAVQPIQAMMLMDATACGYRDNNFHAWRSTRLVRASVPVLERCGSVSTATPAKNQMQDRLPLQLPGLSALSNMRMADL